MGYITGRAKKTAAGSCLELGGDTGDTTLLLGSAVAQQVLFSAANAVSGGPSWPRIRI